MRDLHAVIMGRRWHVRFVPLRKVDGDCDPPDRPNKQIRIDSRLRGEKRLEIIIHESKHAGGWFRSEEFVLQESKDLARLLWRLGYRCIGEDDE